MKPGPRPTPNVIRLLHGNPGRRPINDLAPTPKVKSPTCPKHLNKRAREEWRWITKRLMLQQLISEQDKAVIAIYCVAYARWVEAELEVQKTSAIINWIKRDANGVQVGTFPMQNPWLGVANQAVRTMHRSLAELGLSPSARSQLISMKKGVGGADPFGILG